MPLETSVSASAEAPLGSMQRLERTETAHSFGFLKLRGKDDDLPQKWWFASTAVPLIASAQGPLSNVLSIAALVSPWRVTLANNGLLPEGTDDSGVGIEDPKWELILNAISLGLGFLGNLMLLLHFVGRVRYIVALPLSIICWLSASVILIAITVSLHIYAPPLFPGEIYSQGYWHAVLASITYMFGAVLLMANMLGYLLGHYPQHFDLDDDQRTLIIQTMMYFIWLAGGAGIFTRLEGWSFVDALYYCDVSILTIGFGDFSPSTPAGQGFLFVYELFGIIQLGLVIASISKFAGNMAADKVFKRHQRHARENTFGRSVTSEKELRERLGLPTRRRSSAASVNSRRDSLAQYGELKMVGRTVTFMEHRSKDVVHGGRGGAARNVKPLSRDAKMAAKASGQTASQRRHERRRKLYLLKEEKDRFDAMRQIQDESKRFKQYWSLFIAVSAFAVLWCLGALVFFLSESRMIGMTYFQALYFCFVALLTIGYGDYSPKSNIGKPFFIVWSLIAVPSLTVLIQEMSSTIVASINRGSFRLAEWTIMPKEGVFKEFLDAHPRLKELWQQYVDKRQSRRRVSEGFTLQNPDEIDIGGHEAELGPGDDDDAGGGNKEARRPRRSKEELNTEAAEAMERRLAREKRETEHDLARQLAVTIKRVARDLKAEPPRRYSYEEWVHFTELIRFSSGEGKEAVEAREEEEGLVEWDWIGEDSPMLADVSEAEWVLDRLCESLNRYTRRVDHRHADHRTFMRTHQAHPAPINEVDTPSDEDVGPIDEHLTPSSPAMVMTRAGRNGDV